VQFANNYLHPILAGDANQSVHIVADEGLEAYLPLADMVDVSEEVKRLSKRLSKMQSEYDALVARLNSPSVCAYFCWFPSDILTVQGPFHPF
jgi:valyl-tRNA synthetase